MEKRELNQCRRAMANVVFIWDHHVVFSVNAVHLRPPRSPCMPGLPWGLSPDTRRRSRVTVQWLASCRRRLLASSRCNSPGCSSMHALHRQEVQPSSPLSNNLRIRQRVSLFQISSPMLGRMSGACRSPLGHG
jgi:hypothetical protein